MMTWTPKQKKVIELRDRNILVSAAAGSGKTAVLVERIIQKITDLDNPVDIDKLLIVTFTNAAAAEMRERIGAAIDTRLESDPENEHLQKQSSLVYNAYITTIHSFCLRVIRNNFNKIDLDPSFKIGDEGELKLLKNDVLKKVLEEYYKDKDEDFLHFVECYSTGKTDKELEELILMLHSFSMSYPNPLRWLEECKKEYAIDSLEEMNNTGWLKAIINNTQDTLEDLSGLYKQLKAISLTEDGPYMYEEILSREAKMLEELMKKNCYEDLYNAFNSLSFARLPSKKDESVSSEKREAVKKQRDNIKKALTGLRERYFYAEPMLILEDIKGCLAGIGMLTELTNKFAREYLKAKAEKNLVDYNDLEHFALKILTDEFDKEGVPEYSPSEIAVEFQNNFNEIMIDEYQDSNLVQELLLTSVSKLSQGKNNLFMVGDVKQSIYKFRLARPELFMGKYETYTDEDSENQRIDLDMNFRSRREVLDFTNYCFNQIMDKKLGNIQYNAAAALHTGADYLEPLSERDYETELIIIESDSELIEDEVKTDRERSAMEIEAKAVAKRIKELVSAQSKIKVVEKRTGEYRNVRYNDIVILLRTISGWAETFSSVLMEEGIPAHTSSQTGYFSTVEVTTLLNLLRVIDNPLQDIAFTAVLHSPIGGFSSEELAVFKSEFPDYSMYNASFKYSSTGEHEALRLKLLKFFELLEQFRRAAVYMPIHELIWFILSRTKYDLFISAMPGGEQRRANIDMLVEKAIAFEHTSYKGLFNFVRYIENLNKYNVDYGEAEVINETDDTVRIMSIHKSKGLEFPIVILSGMGKQFNNQDSRAKIIMHPELYIGADYIEPENRIKAPTLIKKSIQRQITLENLGEELRVLYVAMTRAKEKLILTGTVSKLDNKINSWRYTVSNKEKLSLSLLNDAKSYYDWIIPAIIRHKDSQGFLEQYGGVNADIRLPYEEKSLIRLTKIDINSIVNEEIVSKSIGYESKAELLEGLKDIEDNNDIMNALEERLSFKYKYAKECGIHTKMTVSELKRSGQNIDDENISRELIKEEVLVPLIPKFITEEKQIEGSVLGNAYHKVMQLIDYESLDSIEKIDKELNKMAADKRLSSAARECINSEKLYKFACSQLGICMKAAQGRGQLYRERQFVMGVEANKLIKSLDSKEMILIQGIIDAYFEQDGKLTVVDYKTDKVKNRAELVRKYKVQLDYYAEALEKITLLSVDRKIIYSLYLDEEIEV